MEDSGFYRCKKGDTSISHAINVTVTDNEEDKVSHNQSNTTDNKNNEFSPTLSNTMSTTVDDLNTAALQWLWYFVYICSGIVGLLFIVTFHAIRCHGE
ncbi:hypothetical protein QQF64_001012 [Cirrhinus molitorella]|uniref:Uncharacterized protein n=1 Tax=Cirrhinus molitorella TaxID=172907 RepID=A0ABR3NYU8_9TELE